MKRDYQSGVSDTPIFFTGIEVEKTPAYGLTTLFVTGVQEAHEVQKHYDENKCEHIFFGANHSFNPENDAQWESWENLMKAFLSAGKLCSLDIPIKYAEEFSKFWMSIIGTRGATGKRTVNASSQFNNLFEEI